MTFWVPRFKWELVDWLAVYYAKDKKEFERKTKKELWAIYYKTRRRLDR